MRDPWNPTPDEIRAWAFEPHSFEPVQDWDLVISTAADPGLYLELAADDGCPKRRYFLGILYLLVGDAVRTRFGLRSRDDVLRLLQRSRAFAHPAVDAWRERSRALLDDPGSFDYDAWCGGGLPRDSTFDD